MEGEAEAQGFLVMEIQVIGEEKEGSFRTKAAAQV